MRSYFWLKFSIFNFFIVALLGVIMRYKILYSLPFLDQKHLQEAHSHFAFYGWITNAIYVLLIHYLRKINASLNLKKYENLIIINIAASFFMLATFIYGGYFWASILGSTVALLCSFVFCYFYISDYKKINDQSKLWFLGGLLFSVISSVGVFNLAYMKMSGNMSQDWYLASEYYYLHFQYNGFFMFSCIGFLLYSLKEAGAKISAARNKMIFWLMAVGCIVGYGLSVLWMKMPVYIFVSIVLATLAQTVGAVMLFSSVKLNWPQLKEKWSSIERFILMFAGFAFAVKIALQLGSNIPALNQFAFGFRNVVIAYLHLVLLMCIASFLIGQIIGSKFFEINKQLLLGIKLLLLGIFLNELVLGLMGVFSIKYISIPFAKEALLLISVLMFLSIFWMFVNLKKREEF